MIARFGFLSASVVLLVSLGAVAAPALAGNPPTALPAVVPAVISGNINLGKWANKNFDCSLITVTAFGAIGPVAKTQAIGGNINSCFYSFEVPAAGPLTIRASANEADLSGQDKASLQCNGFMPSPDASVQCDGFMPSPKIDPKPGEKVNLPLKLQTSNEP